MYLSFQSAALYIAIIIYAVQSVKAGDRVVQSIHDFQVKLQSMTS